MINQRTNIEIYTMKEIGFHIDQILNYLLPKLIFPGQKAIIIQQFIQDYYNDHGIISLKNFIIDGIQVTTCVHISKNNIISHGSPTDISDFEENELIRIDLVGFKNGVFADAARTFVVGDFNNLDEPRKKLMLAAKESLIQIQEKVVVGDPISKIGKIIEDNANKYNVKVISSMCGHGIGSILHDEPMVLNYYNSSFDKVFIQEGTALCIEPLLSLFKVKKMKTLSDHTILCEDNLYNDFVHFENTFVWEKKKCISLTGNIII